jgi:hypothetical protein
MAVLSPLLNAVVSDGNHTHHHRRKIVLLSRQLPLLRKDGLLY